MIRLLVLIWALLASPLHAEEIIAGVSQNRVAITVNFDGSEIMVFGAVARDAPAPKGKLEAIITITGPSGPVTVQKKARSFGFWLPAEAVEIDAAPAFYAIATTAPLREILSETDDLRYRISIGQAIRSVGVVHQAQDTPAFTEALIRLRRQNGAYQMQDGGVTLDRETLIRADVQLPANLTEGLFKVRIFLLREGHVIAQEESTIDVHKYGIERFLHSMAMDQPLLYGILSLVLAIAAGWLASAAFSWVRR